MPQLYSTPVLIANWIMLPVGLFLLVGAAMVGVDVWANSHINWWLTAYIILHLASDALRILFEIVLKPVARILGVRVEDE